MSIIADELQTTVYVYLLGLPRGLGLLAQQGHAGVARWRCNGTGRALHGRHAYSVRFALIAAYRRFRGRKKFVPPQFRGAVKFWLLLLGLQRTLGNRMRLILILTLWARVLPGYDSLDFGARGRAPENCAGGRSGRIELAGRPSGIEAV